MIGPIATNVVVFIAPYQTWRAGIHAIRNEVFVCEQHVPAELEIDNLDETAIHALLTERGHPVATGRLLNEGRIGRIAVLADWRRRGYGARIATCLIDEARRLGMTSVCLHAQTHALRFYEKLGFHPDGPPFMEAGIEHLNMCLTLR